MDNQNAGLISADLPTARAWESVPAAEADAMQLIVRALESRVRKVAMKAPARRDAHPKAHGYVQSDFRVLDSLPSRLQVGLFAQPRTLHAWIRFSNGSESIQADAIGDGRGMATKLMGVTGSPSSTQDFILINNSTFFARDIADYVDFESATNSLQFFFPSLSPFRFRVHELLQAGA